MAGSEVLGLLSRKLQHTTNDQCSQLGSGQDQKVLRSPRRRFVDFKVYTESGKFCMTETNHTRKYDLKKDIRNNHSPDGQVLVRASPTSASRRLQNG